MIVYRLVCEEGHEFDAWFPDSAAYDKQASAGLLECAVCGSSSVSKAIMAPNVATKGAIATRKAPKTDSPAQMMSKMAALARKMGEHVRENFDYVGDRFAEEARRIHDGDADERGIYGEASKEDVKELLEDGVPIAPLPPAPEKAN